MIEGLQGTMIDEEVLMIVEVLTLIMIVAGTTSTDVETTAVARKERTGLTTGPQGTLMEIAVGHAEYIVGTWFPSVVLEDRERNTEKKFWSYRIRLACLYRNGVICCCSWTSPGSFLLPRGALWP